MPAPRPKSRRNRSGVDQADAALDPFEPVFDAVDPIGDAGILLFEQADAGFELLDVEAHFVDGRPDVPQMLQNQIIRCLAHEGIVF